MHLIKLALKDFRCYQEVEVAPLGKLAVIVGENDVGKTVLMDAIAILLGSNQAGPQDLRSGADGTRSDEFEIRGQFLLEDHDTLQEEYRVDGHFTLIRRLKAGQLETYVDALGYDDAEFDDFRGAEKQKALLTKAGLRPGTNEGLREQQLAQLVAEGRLHRNVLREQKLPTIGVISDHLPKVERIASTEYRSPETMVQRTLLSIAASVMHPVDPETGQPKEHSELTKIRQEIVGRLNQEIDEVKTILQRINPSILEMSVLPSIDFSRAVASTALSLNTGEGERPLSSFGEGTKKRMWMGLLEWEREAAKKAAIGSTIRLYDEPDVNLHYRAQRELFKTISALSSDEELHTQCFVSTHAVTLIDRAPCEAINLIEFAEDGGRKVTRIHGGENPDVMRFFNEVGRVVGLPNSVVLYEKAFLLVEGDSEWVALPILYRLLHGKAMSEDGLVLINLHTCSAWRSVVEVLLHNRLPITHLLLDGCGSFRKTSPNA